MPPAAASPPPHGMLVPISSSALLGGLACPRQVWLRAHTERPSDARRRLLEAQYANVLDLVRTQHGDGVWLRDLPDDAAARATQAHLNAPACTRLYGAVLRVGPFAVRIDLLERRALDAWAVWLVRAFTTVRRRHRQVVLPLALSCHALETHGLTVAQAGLLHMNRGTTYPELEQPLVAADHSKRAVRAVPEIREALATAARAVAASEAPSHEAQALCRRCSYQEPCWSERGLPPVLTLPWGNHTDRRDDLLAAGHHSVAAVADQPNLPAVLRRHLDALDAGEPVVDQAVLERLLEPVAPPVHFLDFEALSPSVPLFSGMRPWQPIPFQYSLHSLGADGALTHTGYLHRTATDPRRALAEQLLDAVPPAGRLVVYAEFESRILTDLAAAFPDLAADLAALRARLWDLHRVFGSRAYHDARFRGSTSLKTVTDVLAPHLSYGELAVSDGAEAQLAYRQARRTGPDDPVLDALWAYCRRDTYAMVEIYRRLVAVAPAS